MSTLVLKLSNINIIRYGNNPLADQKKTLIKGGVVLFAIILIAYVCLMGKVVESTATLKKMSTLEKQEMNNLEIVESKVLSENKDLNISYFIGQGYVEPKNLQVIKRKPDVAKNALSYFY